MTEISSDKLVNIIDQFEQANILCVGDLILDTYNRGAVRRISPESPIPVFDSGEEENVPGGAANVARNIAMLGGHCTLVGLVGDDKAGKTLADELSTVAKIQTAFVKDPTRVTSHKIRYVAQGQHMLRVDAEVTDQASAASEDALVEQARQSMKGSQVVILSDYAKGVLTDRVISEIISAAHERGLAVIVDPKSSNLARYAGADLLTPNLKEAAAAFGDEIANSDDAVIFAGNELIRRANLSSLLITRSERGMTLVSRDEAPRHIHSEAREVFDVVGAGDTVVATLAVGLASGLKLPDAANLANVAAGIVVAKHGTAAVSPAELLDRLKRRNTGLSEGVFLSGFEEAADFAAARRAEGKRVGFTNGVFDLLHPGHISILNFSREACDCLIVGVNSDSSVKRLGKGDDRPINSESDRAAVLCALGVVDAAVVFSEDTPHDLILKLKPDVLVKGADYTVETVVGADFVQSYGGEVRLAPLVAGKSSTSIIQRAKQGLMKE